MDTPPRGTLVSAGPVRRPTWPDRTGRRRPSGVEYVRERSRASREVWIAAAVFAGSVTVLVALRLGAARAAPVQPFDAALTNLLGGGRVQHRLAEDLDAAAAILGYRVLWAPVALVLVWFGRWRHLLVYLGSISVIATFARVERAVGRGMPGSTGRVEVPAWPVLVLAAVVTASLLVLVPRGPARRWSWPLVVVAIAAMGAARIALGWDHPSAVLASAALGSSAAALAVLLFAPESRFPIVYRREVKAHLPLDAARTTRVIDAVRDQLGVEVTEVLPYRLDGSAGSTPCRLGVRGQAAQSLFGKLYATTHLRSDRWYKLFRVLRYGRLEDEAPFSSVRRLVEHEDYMLRLLRDGGVRVPEPLGVVEVLPGHEYVLVTEFVDGAVEILESDVSDQVVDDALRQIAMLWQAGAAHRDIKPSNILARDGKVFLIDVSFGELRPSRWRQAVDLANMMLTLALVTGPERVLAGARRFFDPDELAEAFASTSSVTVPRQLHRRLDADGRELLEQFRRLLPERPRIRVQRWSMRRVLLALATAGGAGLSVALITLNLRAGGLL